MLSCGKGFTYYHCLRFWSIEYKCWLGCIKLCWFFQMGWFVDELDCVPNRCECSFSVKIGAALKWSIYQQQVFHIYFCFCHRIESIKQNFSFLMFHAYMKRTDLHVECGCITALALVIFGREQTAWGKLLKRKLLAISQQGQLLRDAPASKCKIYVQKPSIYDLNHIGEWCLPTGCEILAGVRLGGAGRRVLFALTWTFFSSFCAAVHLLVENLS